MCLKARGIGTPSNPYTSTAGCKSKQILEETDKDRGVANNTVYNKTWIRMIGVKVVQIPLLIIITIT